ncbi:MAG: hypothetical protein V4651_06525 [Bacteroidota bacterium]
MKQKWTSWLFNPFMYLAGWQAMIAGFIMMLVVAGLASLSSIRFDGTLDMHVADPLNLVTHIQLIFVDYISLSVLLLIAGMLMSKSHYRIIDIMGTQLLARWPLLFMTLLALIVNLDPIREAGKHFDPQHIDALFTISFMIFLCVSVIITVWMIVLMYRSYSISFNLIGNKAIGSFIVCLLLAEILSKFINLKLV